MKTFSRPKLSKRVRLPTLLSSVLGAAGRSGLVSFPFEPAARTAGFITRFPRYSIAHRR